MAKTDFSWQAQIKEAAYLLDGQVRHYNGGQTVRHEEPTPQEVERAKAHAAVAAVLLEAEKQAADV